jgi:hypothetical protein
MRIEYQDLRELLQEVLKTVPDPRSVWCVPSNRFETRVARRRGLLVGGAWAPQFLSDTEDLWPVPWTLELKGPRVLLAESATAPFWKWLPLLESVAKADESLIVVADEIGEELIRTLVGNFARRALRACAVRSPAGAAALGHASPEFPRDHRRLPCVREAWIRKDAAVLFPGEETAGADEIAVIEVGGEDVADQRARLRFLAEAIRTADRTIEG